MSFDRHVLGLVIAFTKSRFIYTFDLGLGLMRYRLGFRSASSAVSSPSLASDLKVSQKRGEVILNLPSTDFIFSQCSIVSSVMVEPNSYFIHPETSQFVNANGDTWTNEALKANYKSFIGSYNFVNHVQEPEQSVGFIADAVLRRRVIDPENHVYVYYTDILVCTHRDFSELTSKILTGQIQYLSMGCDMEVSTCSVCGAEAQDEISVCEHLRNQRRKYFMDLYGVKRIVAEMLGNDQWGSVTFIEASWLTSSPPAFEGAVRRHLLSIPSGVSVSIPMFRGFAKKEAVCRFVSESDILS